MLEHKALELAEHSDRAERAIFCGIHNAVAFTYCEQEANSK